MDLFGLTGEPAETPTGQAEPPLSRPRATDADSDPLATTVKGSPLDEFPNVAQIVGEVIQKQEPAILKELDWRQKKNICLIARSLVMLDQNINGENIWNLWPVGLNSKNQVLPSITDPEERGKVFRAGFRPTINQLQEFIKTQYFVESMKEMGIEVDPDDHGLTAEQMGFLTILSDISDGKDLKRKLRSAGVSWSTYQVWLKQPAFKAAYEKYMGDTLKDVIPFAQQQLAAKMAAGDTAATKLGFEITGFHDPTNRKQVDAQLLIQIILDVIEEEEKDPEILKRIANKISLRGARALGSSPE